MRPVRMTRRRDGLTNILDLCDAQLRITMYTGGLAKSQQL